MSQSATPFRASPPHRIVIAWVVAAIAILPLIGVLLAGRSVQPYLEFPPITRPVAHEPFSWPVFIGLAVVIAGMLAPFVIRMLRSSPFAAGSMADRNHAARATFHERRVSLCRFPWWGWLALFWTLGWWFLAWTRFEWMQPLQPHTFLPLWLGYIVLVNALTFRRTGHCMLLHRPRYFLSLFPLSAAFWWFFEYLNRFVQNWHYVGGGELSEWEYLVRATLPFSTVLPAVLGTAECLTASPRCSAGLDQFVTLEFKNRKTWGWTLLIGSAVGLFGIGLWPDYLFSLVWVAPLLLITSLQLIRDEPTIFNGTAHGDWRTLWAAALAALICGCFWEMWNFYSLARWEYAVPFVHRFKLFEMPLLGYAGYLPFGLECLAVADLCLSREFSGGVAYYRAVEGATDLAQRKPTVAER
ncbi:MAG: hypothetical protein H8K10_13545 [Nitrospira sp.]|nr:hypothetical protein [Nitrospira sp.]